MSACWWGGGCVESPHHINSGWKLFSCFSPSFLEGQRKDIVLRCNYRDLGMNLVPCPHPILTCLVLLWGGYFTYFLFLLPYYSLITFSNFEPFEFHFFCLFFHQGLSLNVKIITIVRQYKLTSNPAQLTVILQTLVLLSVVLMCAICCYRIFLFLICK